MIDTLRMELRSWLGIEDQRWMLTKLHREVEQHGMQIDGLARKVSDLVKNKASARQLGRNDEKVMMVLAKVRSTQAEVIKKTAALEAALHQ